MARRAVRATLFMNISIGIHRRTEQTLGGGEGGKTMSFSPLFFKNGCAERSGVRDRMQWSPRGRMGVDQGKKKKPLTPGTLASVVKDFSLKGRKAR